MNSILFYYTKILDRLRGKAIASSKIDRTAYIGNGSNIIDCTFDRYSYCGHDCVFDHVDVGSFTSISDHVYIGGAEHPMDWVSMSPVFQNKDHSAPKKRFVKEDLTPNRRTKIGCDVWIGHAVTIKQGVVIGHGAVVGSNALVTKDVPPYAVVGGVPAKILKYRFDEQTIQELLNCRWWEKSDEQITECSHLIKNPINFIKRINELG